MSTIAIRIDPNGAQQGARVVKREMADIKKAAQEMERQVDGAGDAFRRFKQVVAGLGLAVAIRQLSELTSAWTDLRARVNLAAGSIDAGAMAMTRLTEMARRSYSALGQTADAWLRNADALKALNVPMSQQLDMIESINNALVISAIRGQRAQTVQDAWSKAVALGKLSGDQLNTVIMDGGRLTQALADSMGVSVLALRELGQEGKIGRAEMLGLTNQLSRLRSEAEQMPATLGDFGVLAGNRLTEFVGKIDTAMGASTAFAASLISLTDKLPGLADWLITTANAGGAVDAALKLLAVTAGTVAVVQIGRLAASMIAASAASGIWWTALQLLTVQGGAAIVMTQAWGAAIKFALGPVGLMIAAIGAITTAWFLWDRAVVTFDESISTVNNSVRDFNATLNSYNELQGTISADTARLNTLQETLTVALGTQETAAADLARTELTALADRIRDNERLAGVYEDQLRLQRAAAQNALIGARGAFEQNIASAASITFPGIDRGQLLANKAALEEYADVIRRAIDANIAAGRPVAETHVEFLRQAQAVAEAEMAVANISDALDNLGQVITTTPLTLPPVIDQAGLDAAEDYIKSLREQIQELGKVGLELERIRILRAAAEAPTDAQREQIELLGSWYLALSRLADKQAVMNSLAMDSLQSLAAGKAGKQGPDGMSGAAYDVEAANAQLEILRTLDQATQTAAQSMAQAWGGVGEAIGGVTAALSRYGVDRAAMEAAMLAEISNNSKQEAEIRARYAQIGAQAEISHRADVLAAAKNVFKENSTGYKVMEAAEKAFRAVEMAMSVRAMVQNAIETTASVANSNVKGAASAAAGAAKMFEVLGPFGFAAVAAMMAVLVGLGLKGGGGGGGASYVSAEQQQARQGTGSVLGDAEAKSASLANSLQAAEAYQNRDLEYSSAMVRSLRVIESNIGAVATVLARTLGVAGGPFDVSGLNLGKTGSSGILGALFGSTTKRELTDQGIQFGSQSIADILGGGISGNTYQDILTTKKSKFLGITTSNKSSMQTLSGGLDSGLASQLGALVASLRDGVLAAAGVLGVEGARATLDALTLNIGRLSLEGMTGSEIEEALSAVFGKAADDMAAAIVPGILELQKVGEGAFETLTRLARTYQVVDVSLKSIGKTFDLVGVASLAARSRLVDLFGGIENFVEATDAFAEAFLTEGQRIAPVASAVSAEMNRLGLGAVSTKDQFAELVGMIDVTTASGAELYATMLQVAPAFAKVRDYIDEIAAAEEARLATLGGQLTAAEDAVTRARADLANIAQQGLSNAQSALRGAYEAQSSELAGVIGNLRTATASLREFRAALGSNPLAGLSPQDAYQQASQQFRALNPADPANADKVQEAGRALVDASRAYNASGAAFQADLRAVQSAVDIAIVASEGQLSVAEQQLAQLEASVSGLIDVRAAVVTVAEAITAARAAQAAVEATQVQQAQTAQAVAEQNLATAIQSRDLAYAAYVTQQQVVAAARELAASESGNWAQALPQFEQQKAATLAMGDILREQIQQGYALSEAARAQARDLSAAETAYAGAISQAEKADAWARLQIEQQQAQAIYGAETAFAQTIATGAAAQSKSQFDAQQATAYDLFNQAQAAAETRSVNERVAAYNAGIVSASAALTAAGQINSAAMMAADQSQQAILAAANGTQSAIYGASANLGALLSAALGRIETRLAANDNSAAVAAPTVDLTAQARAAILAGDATAVSRYLAANPDVQSAYYTNPKNAKFYSLTEWTQQHLINFPGRALFASGGYTGAGSMWEPAGTVHRGEYVMPAQTVQREGLSAMRDIHYGRGGNDNDAVVGELRKVNERLARLETEARADKAQRAAIHNEQAERDERNTAAVERVSRLVRNRDAA